MKLFFFLILNIFPLPEVLGYELTLDPFQGLSSDSLDTMVDRKSFTKTGRWRSSHKALLEQKAIFENNRPFYESFKLAPPPKNSSLHTKEELAYLLRIARTSPTTSKVQIVKEMDFHNWEIGPYLIGSLINHDEFIADYPYFESAFGSHLLQAIFFYKKKYDRIRPHLLEPRVKPRIPVPLHPAYPSGHSTQAHFLAYVFANIDPANEKNYLCSAYQIAKNREKSGVHYPSDSEAGKNLAKAFFDFNLKSENFRKELQRMKEEIIKTHVIKVKTKNCK